MLSKIFSYPLVRPYILYYNHSSAVQKDFKEDTETFSNLAESKWSPNYYVKLVNSSKLFWSLSDIAEHIYNSK